MSVQVATSPDVQHLQTFWTLISPSDVTIGCALYRTAAGVLELRAGHGEGDRLLVQRVHTFLAAEIYAELWKTAAQAKGFRAPTSL